MNFVKRKAKAFFWLFGIIFTYICYLVINHVSLFEYIKNSSWLAYAIYIVILLLFFIVGLFFSKIPNFFYVLFFKPRMDLNDVIKEVKISENEDDVNLLVEKFKKVIKIISRYGYSKKATLNILESIGFTKEQSEKISKTIIVLKNMKIFIYFTGFIIGLIVYAILISLPSFNFLYQITPLLPIVIALVVFILFVIEANVVTQLPDSFYLNLTNITNDKMEKYKQEVYKNKIAIKKFQKLQKQNVLEIKNTVKYLLKQNIKKSWIANVLKNYSIDEKVANDLINSANAEIKNSKVNNLNESDKLQDATIKLSLAKIQENFMTLKELYSKIQILQKNVKDISRKQSVLEKVYSKEKAKVSIKELESKKNLSKFKKQGKVLKKKLDHKDFPKINMDVTDKGTYKKYIDFMYNIIRPQVENYTKQELYAILLSEGYKYEFVDDVIQKLEDNKVKFKTKKSSKFSFVDLINNLYFKISRK